MADGRQALLDAAYVEFAARGYAATSVRDVLARAGVTAPVLYHHFGSKAGLYTAVASVINDRVFAGFERAAARHRTYAEKLVAVLEASRSAQAENPALAAFLLSSPLDVARNVELARLGGSNQRLTEFAAGLGRPEHLTRQQATDLALGLIMGFARMAATQSPRRYRESVAAAATMIRSGLV